jgi:hypothetical protein
LLSKKPDPVNPFLFIRGLSCPGRVQTSLTQNWLKLSIHGFPYNNLLVSVVTLALKNLGSSIGMEIRPQSVFTAFRALLPSANNAAE